MTWMRLALIFVFSLCCDILLATTQNKGDQDTGHTFQTTVDSALLKKDSNNLKVDIRYQGCTACHSVPENTQSNHKITDDSSEPIKEGSGSNNVINQDLRSQNNHRRISKEQKTFKVSMIRNDRDVAYTDYDEYTSSEYEDNEENLPLNSAKYKPKTYKSDGDTLATDTVERERNQNNNNYNAYRYMKTLSSETLNSDYADSYFDEDVDTDSGSENYDQSDSKLYREDATSSGTSPILLESSKENLLFESKDNLSNERNNFVDQRIFGFSNDGNNDNNAVLEDQYNTTENEVLTWVAIPIDETDDSKTTFYVKNQYNRIFSPNEDHGRNNYINQSECKGIYRQAGEPFCLQQKWIPERRIKVPNPLYHEWDTATNKLIQIQKDTQSYNGTIIEWFDPEYLKDICNTVMDPLQKLLKPVKKKILVPEISFAEKMAMYELINDKLIPLSTQMLSYMYRYDYHSAKTTWAKILSELDKLSPQVKLYPSNEVKTSLDKIINLLKFKASQAFEESYIKHEYLWENTKQYLRQLLQKLTSCRESNFGWLFQYPYEPVTPFKEIDLVEQATPENPIFKPNNTQKQQFVFLMRVLNESLNEFYDAIIHIENTSYTTAFEVRYLLKKWRDFGPEYYSISEHADNMAYFLLASEMITEINLIFEDDQSLLRTITHSPEIVENLLSHIDDVRNMAIDYIEAQFYWLYPENQKSLHEVAKNVLKQKGVMNTFTEGFESPGLDEINEKLRMMNIFV